MPPPHRGFECFMLSNGNHLSNDRWRLARDDDARARRNHHAAPSSSLDRHHLWATARRRTAVPRAGKEPAEDLRRAIHAAMRRCDLLINASTVRTLKDEGLRFVLVQGRLRDGPPHAAVAVQGFVSMRGDIIGGLKIYCLASDSDPRNAARSAPLLRGRDHIATVHLPTALRQTLAERAAVLAALSNGRSPPFTFDDAQWAIAG